MKFQLVKFTVWKNRQNIVTPIIVVRSSGGVEAPISWAAVNRLVLQILTPTPVIVDTDVHPAALDFSIDGELTLRIGDLPQVAAIVEGEYFTRLTAFDALNPEGVEVWSDDHPETPVILRIIDTATL